MQTFLALHSLIQMCWKDHIVFNNSLDVKKRKSYWDRGIFNVSIHSIFTCEIDKNKD